MVLVDDFVEATSAQRMMNATATAAVTLSSKVMTMALANALEMEMLLVATAVVKMGAWKTAVAAVVHATETIALVALEEAEGYQLA